MVSSGEPLQPRLLRRLTVSLPHGARVLNYYGSTEVAGDCACFDATAWQPPGGWAGLGSGYTAAGSQVLEGAPSNPAEGSELISHVPSIPALDPAEGLGSRSQVPVGTPIDSTVILIARLGGCSADGRPAKQGDIEGLGFLAAAGEVGEVCVAGAGVAAGYLRCNSLPTSTVLRQRNAA